MASISTDAKGNRRVLFTNRDGQRKSVYLGTVPKKQAETVCTKIEALNGAKIAGVAPADEVTRWKVGIGDDLYEKLSKQELVAPRQPENLSSTVEDWLTKYIDQRRSELKPGNTERLERTAGRLKSSFGGQARLDELTPAGAADWRAAMLAEKQPHKRGEVPKPRLTETTVRNYSRDAKTIFNAAVDRELIARNAFRKLKSSVLAANRDRYVTPEEAGTILDGCHSSQWRVLFGLARIAGLRTPRETHRLTWADVDWERKLLSVYAPKTDSTRIVPITADLFPLLQVAFDSAPAVPSFDEWVKTTLKADLAKLTKSEKSTAQSQYENDAAHRILTLGSHRSNLHRGLEKFIKRVGLAPWDDLFQTLRRSAESDFARTHPQHAVSKWIGHSMAVSERHYLQVTDDLLDTAVNAPGFVRRDDAHSDAVHVRTSLQVQETRRNAPVDEELPVAAKECEKPQKTGAFLSSKSGTRTRDPRLMKPVPTGQTVEANVLGGLDLGYSGQHRPPTSGAESGALGARDDGLNRLCELWPMLSEFDRLALVDHADHLVALRVGGDDVAVRGDGDASGSRLPASDRSGQATARPVKGRGRSQAKASLR